MPQTGHENKKVLRRQNETDIYTYTNKDTVKHSGKQYKEGG